MQIPKSYTVVPLFYGHLRGVNNLSTIIRGVASGEGYNTLMKNLFSKIVALQQGWPPVRVAVHRGATVLSYHVGQSREHTRVESSS